LVEDGHQLFKADGARQHDLAQRKDDEGDFATRAHVVVFVARQIDVVAVLEAGEVGGLVVAAVLIVHIKTLQVHRVPEMCRAHHVLHVEVVDARADAELLLQRERELLDSHPRVGLGERAGNNDLHTDTR